MRKVLRREAACARVRVTNTAITWPAVLVFPNGQKTLALSVFPSFTKSTTQDTVNGVMLLTAQNSVDPTAKTIAKQRVLFGSDPSIAPFNLIAEAMLRWGVWMQTGANGTVMADDLAELQAILQTPGNAFDAATVSSFLGANFSSITIGPAPMAPVSAAVFPMFPQLSLATTDGINVDFNMTNSVGTQYQTNIPAYFQLLSTQYQARTGSPPKTNNLAPTEDTTVSMASIVFAQYFLMLIGSAVQSAIDYLAAFPYTTPSAQTLAQVAAATDPTITSDPSRIVEPNLGTASIFNTGAFLALPDVLHQVMLGDSFASVATTFSRLGAFNFNSAPQPLGATDVAAANLTTTNLFNSGTTVPITGILYTTNAADTLNLIAARLLIRAVGNAVLSTLTNLQTGTAAFLRANPSITDPKKGINVGMAITVPATLTSVAVGPYVAVVGDTLTLVAAYFVAVAQTSVASQQFVSEIQNTNSAVQSTDPNAPLDAGTQLTIPPVTRVIAFGDSMASLAITLITTSDVIQSAMLTMPSCTNLLSPQAVLSVPLQYQLTATDTFGGIAATFSLTVDQLAANVGSSQAVLFGANASLIISDVASIDTDTLTASLLNQGEWNNLSGYVSRFFLSGLQLPDSNNGAFASTTPQELTSTPSILATFPTVPLYAATAQQFPVDSSPPSDYQITLSNTGGVSWLGFEGGSTLPITLSQEQRTLITTIATTNVAPAVQNLSRLALFQMVPARITLQQHIAWQAASLPSGCFTSSRQATTNPSMWLFPTSLIEQLQSGPIVHELVSATHSDPNQNVTANQVGCYAWGTIVDITLTPPIVDGPAQSVSNAYVVEGADDTGADVLQQLYTYLTSSTDSATIFLLYSPSPTSTNPSGLSSDQLSASTTFLLKSNLSTVTNASPALEDFTVVTDPTDLYVAGLTDPTGFIALLWEASITRSGGFYLQYVNQNGGAGLPGSVFGNQSRATLSVLVLLQSQLSSATAPLQPFNNCAVVGTNIDPSSTNLFVQPVTVLAAATDTLTTLAAAYNTNWDGTLAPSDVANINATVQLLLLPGVSIATPSGGTNTIVYGDTFQTIATTLSTTVTALANAGANATIPMFQTGAQVQFALGVLQPSSTVPPGTVGFEMSRAIPDPDSDPVDTLFNLIGWSVVTMGGFMASGEGLPTTPAESDQDGTDGLMPRPLDELEATEWNYSQSMNVAPFAKTTNGSVSLSLPAAQWNPYNGVGPGAEVTLHLVFQDIYGNEASVPPWNTLPVPVGYFDQLVSFASWPSMAMAYLVTAATAPAVTIQLLLSMQQARYIPSATLSFASAQQATSADLLTYTTIYYQLAQPDVGLTIATSLAPAAGSIPLSLAPLAMFVRSAYVWLAALNELAAVTASGALFLSMARNYQVTPTQLFSANATQLYSALFGSTVLSVPQTYITVENDSLNSIAEQLSVTAPTLVTNNAAVPLNPGVDLDAPSRTTTATATDSLSTVALRMQASPAGIVNANASAPILAGSVTFTVGTQSYTTTAQDNFTNVAGKIGAMLDAVAAANQFLIGIFIDPTALTISDVVAATGDSLQSLAAQFSSSGFSVTGLAAVNETLSNLFAPGTSLIIGNSQTVKGPAADDTLASFAAENNVGLAQLVAFNPNGSFASTASLSIPGLVSGASTLPYSIYPAGPADTLGGIAAKFSRATEDSIATLNIDLPGLIAGGQTITDTGSGKSVTTEAGDTFDSIIARFWQQQVVTVTVAQLAADMASVPNLLLADALWIAPPMLAANCGTQPTNSLAGFAALYNLDPLAVATANAASQGFLAPQISFAAQFTVNGQNVTIPITTGTNETFNSLITKVAQAGYDVTIAEVATAALSVANLLKPAAVAVPVVSPVAISQTVTPSFTETIFPISVSLATTRNIAWVDPDFTGETSVFTSTYAVTALSDPDTHGNLTLDTFATDLQAAIPGIAVATGEADGTPGNAPVTIWGVNFSSSISTPVTVTFPPASVQFFALPPLSNSLLSGTFDIHAYTTGSGLGAAVSQTFQAVDLDVWLNTFLGAIDLVLSPAYAVPAYASDAASLQTVISTKAKLALFVSQRVDYVLAGQNGGSLADAQTALYQAMLNHLSSAITVNTLVQVPVTVSSPFSGDLAPLLNGKISVLGQTADEVSAFSFSTAKIDLASGASTATSLFTVKSPTSHPNVTLDLQFDTVEMEVPSGPALIGDYQPSNWLQFILAQSSSTIGSVAIPIPLRAYPSPVTLLSQVAQQTFSDPASVSDLLLWNFDFVYDHQDAPQDSATVSVTFGGEAASLAAFHRGPRTRRLYIGRDDTTESAAVNVQAIFHNLAQFMAVWPALLADLGLLPFSPPGTSTTNAKVAVETFATLVENVANAWNQSLDETFDASSSGTVYTWSLVKEGTSDAERRLTITAPPNPTELWPNVYATLNSREQQLSLVSPPTATQAVYQYPSGCPLDTVFPQRFVFNATDTTPPAKITGIAPQTYQFTSNNVMESISGLAGVSITRNAGLIPGVTTNHGFVYQTPLSSFPNAAVPSIFAGDVIVIGSGDGSGIAAALQTVFETLFASVPAGLTVSIRLTCSYSYTLATAVAGGGVAAVTALPALLPVFLVPSYAFNPQVDENASNSTSFVAQVQAFISTWASTNNPQMTNGAYAFGLTVFGPSASTPQPLIRATTLLYSL